MSRTLSESDIFTPAVPVPNPLDIDYTTTVPGGMQALANRTRRLALTIGEDTSATTWDQQPESFFTADTDGSFPFFLPQVNRATPLRSALGNIAAKVFGLRGLLNSNVATLTSGLANLSAKVWGAGLAQELAFLPVPLCGINSVSADNTYWYQTTRVAVPPGVRQGILSGNPVPLFVPPLPINGIIDYAEVTVQGLVAGHVWPLGNVPTLSLHKVSAAGADTVIATAADGSGSAGTYEGAHTIRATVPGSIAVQASYSYYLSCTGENSTNAIADSFIIYSCRLRLR